MKKNKSILGFMHLVVTACLITLFGGFISVYSNSTTYNLTTASTQYYFYIFIAAIVLVLASFIFRKRLVKQSYDSDIGSKMLGYDNWTAKAIGSGLIATDINGVIAFINPAAEKITGFSKTEALNKELSEIFRVSEQSNYVNELSKCTILCEHNIFDSILTSKDGKHISISTSVSSIYDTNNIPLGFILVFHNTNKSTFTDPLSIADMQSCTSSICASTNHSYSGVHYDDLTKLPNRKHFYNSLSSSLLDTDLADSKTAVLFIDLDLFKNVNDTLGHNIGDILLQETASRLVSCLNGDRSSVARMGGDEFAVLMKQVNSEAQILDTARNFLTTLSTPFLIGDHELLVSASIGIAIYPEHGESMQELLKNAASSMYKAKEQGRNNYQIYTPDINENTLQRYTIQKSLRRALEREELLLHYQPKVDGKTGQLVGIEALVRWQHPEKGLIFPIDFIPIAEETGIIKQIDEWVLRTACLQLKKWIESGHKSLRLAVNLSAWQFKEQHLAETVAAVLSETGINANDLELEITETAAMENLNFTVNTLGKLMLMGVNISIDDFGTGYSSLNYLKHFPINFLKIDRTFISDILEDKNTCAIVKAIIEVAHTLNLKVIAEGVETQEQLELLQQLGCDEIQGFFISKPLPVDEIEKRMSSKS